MKFHIFTFALVAALVLPLSAAAQQVNTPRKLAVHRSSAQAHSQQAAVPATPAPQPATPQQPASPPTPEQGPSSPPQVSFQGGQLTIEARNSTMADVLNAVKQNTGAAVEMPAASSERVVGRFGPGAPRDVLAQLLNGSHYDYVLLGSPADPGALKKVVLMARAVGPEPAPSQQNVQQNLQAVPAVDNDQNTTDDTSADVSNDVPQPDDQSQVPDQNLQQDQPQPGQNGPVVKTPEQLLRELQQQQQQQQQNPPQQ